MAAAGRLSSCEAGATSPLRELEFERRARTAKRYESEYGNERERGRTGNEEMREEGEGRIVTQWRTHAVGSHG